MSARLIPVAPERRNVAFDRLRAAFGNGNAGLLLVGVAYATRDGVDALLRALRPANAWPSIQKRILIGIHQGITEPAALELLLSTPKSDVRAYVPGNTLNVGVFSRAPTFHPKFLALTDSTVGNIVFIQVGSANLSAGAVGPRPKNFELSIAVEKNSVLSPQSKQDFAAWWSRLWASSKRVDDKFITAYAKLRLQLLERNPIIRQIAGAPIGIQTARNFFVEVGAGSGPPGLRHQVEFPRALAAFFGKPLRGKRQLTLASHGASWPKRPLSYKKTTYNVEIWRLGMPTQVGGGVPIAERAIMFRRSDEPDKFEFEVADVGDNDFSKWNQEANLRGHIGATHGSRPRLYGFY